MKRPVRVALWTAGILGALALVVALGWTSIQRWIVIALSEEGRGTAPPPSDLSPKFDGRDASRPRIDVSLTPVVTGVPQPTDVQFPPGRPGLMFVLGKEGTVYVVADGKPAPWLTVSVLTASEQGLLGLAFHPRFAENGRFFLNLVTREGKQDVTHVEEWAVSPGGDLRAAKPERKRVLLAVPQPYPNHNAGQLAFGPDGKLYVGLGDGGWRNDPQGHGQNPATLLGSMLRLDVDGDSLVPADNPFVGRDGFRPEVWAYGLRNPWRYTFTPDGRLVVADVGQDRWEEIAIVGRGENHGWNRREAFHCFPPETKCSTEGLTDPIYEYGREEGISVTGGVVVTGGAIPALRGRYLFGDYGTGRLWALDLEGATAGRKVDTAYALGRWPVTPTAFGRDDAGEAYVADFNRGIVYKIVPPAAK